MPLIETDRPITLRVIVFLQSEHITVSFLPLACISVCLTEGRRKDGSVSHTSRRAPIQVWLRLRSCRWRGWGRRGGGEGVANRGDFSELYLCLRVVQQLPLQCLSLLGDADESADVSCYFGLRGALEAGGGCVCVGGGGVFGGDRARLSGRVVRAGAVP